MFQYVNSNIFVHVHDNLDDGMKRLIYILLNVSSLSFGYRVDFQLENNFLDYNHTLKENIEHNET